MFKNYLKIALRNTWKNKGYAFINIFGLSVAFCISIFLLLTAYFHLSFDQFHEQSGRIFQAYIFSNEPARPERRSAMPYPVVPALKQEFPDAESVTSVESVSEVLTYRGRVFDKRILLTDPDFFKVFSFELVKGSSETALNDLSSILLSESTAIAVFNHADPMGKQIEVGTGVHKKSYRITGIIADAPENSSVQYEAITRFESAPGYSSQQNKWQISAQKVFLKLTDNGSQSSFETRARPFAQKYFSGRLAELKNKGAKPDIRGDLCAIRLQKLTKIHFDTELSGGGAPIVVIYTLLGLAIFILLIACFNFINLNVARSFIRAREIGVRKYLGALRSQLIIQIWGEAAVICLLGFLAGLVLAVLLLPAFNAAFQGKLSMHYILGVDKLAMLIALLMLVTLLAGGYPALLMSKFSATEVLKGKVSLKRPGMFRTTLIVVQFTISTLLICSTVIAVRQVDFLLEQPLGFEKEQVISIPLDHQTDGALLLRRLRNKFASDPNIVSITGSGVNLGYGLDKGFYKNAADLNYNERIVTSEWLRVDFDYLKTLSIKLSAGRDFNPTYPTDSVGSVLITERMARQMGENDPVGKILRKDSSRVAYQVIGVIPDFNLYSAKSDVRPIVMHLSNAEPLNYIFVRVTPQSLKGAMNKLKVSWRELAPESKFLGSFMDDNVDGWYEFEVRLSRIISLASAIAILLSCLGLFAVALIVIEQRSKEIGVRKVLGATVANLFFVLAKDFLKMVLIALVIATPISWLMMQKWLNLYAYRTEISPMIFLTIGLISIFIALATVSYQSIKAALVNPTTSLKGD
jgi:putative ABC transport system permease protein